MKKREGLLFVVSAPSGAGKTSLCRAVTEKVGNLRHSTSYTTRKPRPGEIDGRDYYFVTVERFRSMIDGGEFAEWAEVHSNFYGTSKRILEEMRAEGIDVILDIDTQGAKQIKNTYNGEIIFMFIMPPTLEILEERLRNRKSDHENEIKKRMQRARDEMRDYPLYNYVIVNRDFDRALLEMQSIITAERCRTRLIDPDWISGILS
jgi:guanylate kinase